MKEFMLMLMIKSVIMWIIVIIVLVFVFKTVYRKYILPKRCVEEAKKTPVIRVQSILVAKSMEVRPYRSGSISVFFLVFELSAGAQKIFSVDSITYNTILEGEKGVLTYHELGDTRVFVSFQPVK